MVDAAGAVGPRAFLRVGGATLAAHQLAVARALNCQRVICLAHQTYPELIALQHDAEAAGMQFHILARPQNISGLVTAGDEVLVLAEGLFIDPLNASEIFERGPAVLVQPVEGGLDAGFERIDLNHAAAGILLVPGAVMEGLHALPPDCDVPSALTRIALQAGVRMREVPLILRSGNRWRMIGSESEALAIESEWLTHHVGSRQARSPGFLLARWFVSLVGPALLHSGSASKSVAAATLAVLLIAIGAGWFGAVVLGLILAATAWVLAQALGILADVERHVPGKVSSPLRRAHAFEWLTDAAIVLLVCWGSNYPPEAGWTDALFAPLMLIVILRIVSPIVSDNPSGWQQDRALLALGLAVAAALAVMIPVVQIAAALLGLVGIAFRAGSRG